MVDKVKIVKRIVGEKYFTDDIAVERAKCCGVKHRNATCRRCVEICPKGALSIEKRDLLIDAESCNHCGACITVCPTQALFSNWLPWKDLLASAQKSVEASHGHPVIACTRMLEELQGEDDYDRDKVVELQCLERVDESLLFAMIASGARDIRLACDDCVSCDDGCMGAVWTIVVDDVRAMARTVGCDFPITVVHEIPEDVEQIEHASLSNKKLSRRDLFSGFKDQAVAAANVAFEETLADSTYGTVAAMFGIYAGGETPLDKASRGKVCEWALGSLALAYDSEDGSAESAVENLDGVSMGSRLFSNIYIDGQKCTNCFLCVAYCKTFAIRRYSDKHRTLGFLTTPGLCVQCGLCVDLCKRHAISIDGQVRVTDLLQETTRAITYAKWEEQNASGARASKRAREAREAEEGAAERRARKRREEKKATGEKAVPEVGDDSTGAGAAAAATATAAEGAVTAGDATAVEPAESAGDRVGAAVEPDGEVAEAAVAAGSVAVEASEQAGKGAGADMAEDGAGKAGTAEDLSGQAADSDGGVSGRDSGFVLGEAASTLS